MHRFLASFAAFALSCADAPPTAPSTAAKPQAQQDASCAVDADGFDIELVYLDSFTAAQRAAIDSAAARWEEVVVGDVLDIDDASLNQWSSVLNRRVTYEGAVDDLLVFVGKNPAQTSRASVLQMRWPHEGGQALIAEVAFNPSQLRRSEREGWLYKLVLHELGHALGIGTTWSIERTACDVESYRFTGAAARLAFDMAGGGDYLEPKVPISNDLAHWPASVLAGEIMADVAATDDTLSLSAISVAALGDLGYEVDFAAADPYTLPDLSAAKVSSAVPFCAVGLH